MIDTYSIGAIIKKIRTDKGLTQEVLAEKIDISTNYLSKVERGLSRLNVESFLRMAKVLEFSLEDFGIKTKTDIDKTKEKLIQMILASTDKETKAYLELLNTMNSILKTLK